MKLQDYLAQNYGYNKSVNDNWSKYITLWKSWYRGKVKAFHNYTIYNGHRKIYRERLSLQMSKKCCEDWADLLFNPKCKIALADEASTKQLDEILCRNDFWVLINNAIEKSYAAGTGAIVTSVSEIIYNDDSGTIDVSAAHTKLEYVDIENIYPISWEGKRIRECAFGSRRQVRGKTYIYLSVHVLNSVGNYEIHNKVFIETNGSLSEAENISGAFDVFDTGSSIPWFAIISPAENNNIDDTLPWGLSCYANAIDTLQAIDIGFDSFVNEIILGRKRIFIRGEMVQSDETGEHLVFDDNDVAVYVLPEGVDANDVLQAENSEIRSDAITKYIQSMLSAFSAKVGFGHDKYDFDTASVATATQVISQNSDMFRRKKKNEIPLESALFDIIQSAAYASTHFGSYNIDTDGLVIQFDDSVIENTEAIASRAMREQAQSLISPAEYRMKVFGESKEVAEQRIKEVKEQYPSMNDLIGDGNA